MRDLDRCSPASRCAILRVTASSSLAPRFHQFKPLVSDHSSLCNRSDYNLLSGEPLMRCVLNGFTLITDRYGYEIGTSSSARVQSSELANALVYKPKRLS